MRDVIAGRRSAQADEVGALFARYHVRISRYIAGRLRPQHRDQAEDLAQEVWVRVLTSISQARSGELYPWLAAIARHVVADHYRRQSTTREVLVREDQEQPDAPSSEPTPEATVVEADSVARLLAPLPAARRHAVVRVVLDGDRRRPSVRSLAAAGLTQLREGVAA